MLNWFI